MFREWLGPSPQGASASPSSPPLPLLHLWGRFVFNFLFSVNEKPLGKQPVRPSSAFTARSAPFIYCTKRTSLRNPQPGNEQLAHCKLKCRAWG